MKIPISWLAEYVESKLSPKELAERLTLAGLEVSSFEDTREAWNACIIGQILEISSHPNADRLALCKVDLLDSSPTIICGAPNISVGQKVVLAQTGAILTNPTNGDQIHVQPATIRGVASEGMLCSQRELGLGADHAGIMILPEDAPIGSPLSAYLGDVIFELETTANRPDCLSIIGVAYEIGAIEQSDVHQPDLSYPTHGSPITDQIDIMVESPDLCYRYTASLVTGINVAPSPYWLQQRLINAGLRPINNVVDVTNYVMLEYGQPLHAFNYDSIKGKTIVVREAKDGEDFEGIDGVHRSLAPTMLTISDQEGVIGLAGIIGGANSEITNTTTSVLIESACFHPFNIRRTISDLKLRTEASSRFEKGARPHLTPVALMRATQLMIQLTGGQASKGILDIYPEPQEPLVVNLSLARLENTLGFQFELNSVKTTLASIGLHSDPVRNDSLDVTVPYWRADISIEVDLIEEVARVTGYDRIPVTTLSSEPQDHLAQPILHVKERIRDILVEVGLQEIITYPLIGDKERSSVTNNHLGSLQPWRVTKPISPDHEYLRPNLRAGLLNTLAANQRHDEYPFSLFEVGRIFMPTKNGEVKEVDAAAGLLAGPMWPTSWFRGQDSFGFYDAKGILQFVFRRLGVDPRYVQAVDEFFHPGRLASIESETTELGKVGEIHPVVLKLFEIEISPAIYFEIDLEAITQIIPQIRPSLETPSIYPPAYRDLAIVVNSVTPASSIYDSIISQPLISNATLFDVYTSEQLGHKKKSLAYNLTLQTKDHTLTAEEVNSAMGNLLEALNNQFGAIQRSK